MGIDFLRDEIPYFRPYLAHDRNRSGMLANSDSKCKYLLLAIRQAFA
jgi:hypothetical protein